MKPALAFASHSWLMLKLFYRDRQAVFWNYLFPVLLQVLFCSAFGGGNQDMILFFLSSLLLITIMSGSLYGVGIVIPSLRESGVFRRYRVTPADAWLVVGPAVTARFVVILSTVVLQVLISTAYYHAAPRGSPVTLAAVLLLGDVVFCLLGLIIANTAKAAHTANAMANVLLMPMMFLSGAITPLEKMPEWLRGIAAIFPATWLVDSLRQTLLLGNSLQQQFIPLGALCGFALIFLVVALRNFKWD